ncbi:MAG: hypothetical protein IPJ74_12225 [Saprospiraceae bacterium]|nr:hypothetical protein [Saprospiraceae bacterium]
MLYRLIIVLGCIVLFVNSCNSIISSFTGTHKLRKFTMEQIEQKGVGDSDFVEITGVWVPGDFRHAPPRQGERKGVVQYPAMSQERYQQWQNGDSVRTSVIIWTQGFDPNCVQRGDCITPGQKTIRGIVNKMPKSKNKLKELPAKYQIPERAIFIETERAPLVWYWHLALMGVAVLLGLGVEFIYNRRRKKAS